MRAALKKNLDRKINKEWLTFMLEHAQRKEIGAVGAKLYYPDGTIQHGEVILGIGGVAGLQAFSERVFWIS